MTNTGPRSNSRRQKVHQIFDAQGDAAAIVLGKRLKLADSSVRTWISKWCGSGRENLANNEGESQGQGRQSRLNNIED